MIELKCVSCYNVFNKRTLEQDHEKQVAFSLFGIKHRRREILIGKVLFIVRTFRKGNVIHIISARCATKSERSMNMAKVMMNSLSAELTPEELADHEAAEKMPIVFDDDCPEMTDKMLKQFHRTDTITVKISPDSMKKVKSFGADYPQILSHLLDLALNDADLVKKCM